MVEHSAVNRGVVGSSPTRGVRKSPQTLVFVGFCISEDRREEILAGNILLTEIGKTQWLNEIVAFKSSAFLHKKADFHSGLCKAGMSVWNIYKRKIFTGCMKKKVKLWLSM